MDKSNEYLIREYWEQRLGECFNLAGVGHLYLGQTYNKWAYKARRRVLLETVADLGLDLTGKSVLEIGVGTGFFIDTWLQLGVAELVGLDITPKSVQELKVRYPQCEFIEADVSDDSLSLGRCFDVITAFDVLFHIVEEESFELALHNIAAHCNPDTIILLTDFFMKRPCKEPYKHQNLRTYARYNEALLRVGLALQELRPMFFFLNPPFDSSRLKWSIGGHALEAAWWFNSNLIIALHKISFLERSLLRLWAPVIYAADYCALRRTSTGPSTKLAVVKSLERVLGGDTVEDSFPG